MDCVFVVDRHLLSEVEVSGNVVVESLVGAFLIIEEEVVGQSPIEEWDGLIGVEIDVFVFDGAPESFYEYVVERPTFAVHADADAFVFQFGGESGGRELSAL